MIKILVMGTLLLGSLALLTNMVPTGRQHLRLRRLQGASRTPMALVTAFIGLDASRKEPEKAGKVAGGGGKIFKTEEEWKAALTVEQYRVTRCSDTERPFTGRFWDHKENGTYICVGCGQDLFSSGAKYDAGSGWPSYTGPVDAKAVTEIKDISYGMVRTEIVCSRCEAHLGHVFPDGPRPGQVRYCINSASLDFVGKGEQPTSGD